MADVRPCQAGNQRHLGDPDRPGQQSRHDQRTDQSRQASGLRQRVRDQVAQDRRLRHGRRRGRCWCEPGRDGKCWEKSAAEGSRSITSSRAVRTRSARSKPSSAFTSTSARARTVLGQSPRRPAPARSATTRLWVRRPSTSASRRDCPNFRAVEDRLGNILDFFMSAEGHTDLREARENTRGLPIPGARYTDQDLIADLERRSSAGAVARGREVFHQRLRAATRVSPRSRLASLPGPISTGSTHGGPARGLAGQRWPHLAVSEVGTFAAAPCIEPHGRPRLAGIRLETLRAQPPDPNVKEPGRRWLRLLPQHLAAQPVGARPSCTTTHWPRAWRQTAQRRQRLYAQRPRYVDASNVKLLPAERQPACFEYDPASKADSSCTLSMQACSIPPSASQGDAAERGRDPAPRPAAMGRHRQANACSVSN